MKIFFYINTISSGGAERVLTNLATEMSTRGHECVLITSFQMCIRDRYQAMIGRHLMDVLVNSMVRFGNDERNFFAI